MDPSTGGGGAGGGGDPTPEVVPGEAREPGGRLFSHPPYFRAMLGGGVT